MSNVRIVAVSFYGDVVQIRQELNGFLSIYGDRIVRTSDGQLRMDISFASQGYGSNAVLVIAHIFKDALSAEDLSNLGIAEQYEVVTPPQPRVC